MKRRLITFRRIVVAGSRNFFRNAWLSVAATAVMVVALTIILLAVVLNVTARNAIAELSKNLKVSIYLKENPSQAKVDELKTNLQSTGIIDNIAFVSTDEARQRFTASFQNDDKLLEGLALAGSDTLPASLEITVNDLSRTSDIQKIALQKSYSEVVESVTLGKTDAKKTIDRAAAAQRYITIASIISAAIFAVVSMLIIFNTIRMAIFTRSEEIRIMKLIGATPNYIRGPFLVEASLYGVIAGLLANLAVFSLVFSLGGRVATQEEFAETYDFMTSTSTIVIFVLCGIGIGILVGIISSMFAMEKHLKIKKW